MSVTGKVAKVLSPLALSGRAVGVARESGRLCEVLGAKLTLLHVGDATAANRAAFDEQLQKSGLGDCELLFRPGGKPDRVICDVAGEIGADLIVAGALEQEGPVGYYLGSVARRVARRAGCSVLLLTAPRETPGPFRRWVVDVEYDVAGLAMLRFAMELARAEEPEWVDAAYEYELPGFGMASGRGDDVAHEKELRDRLHREEETTLMEFLAGVDLSSVSVHGVCLQGREGWESLEHARRRGADLLIMLAPPKLTFLDKLFPRGVEYALKSLPCALWLYREPRGGA